MTYRIELTVDAEDRTEAIACAKRKLLDLETSGRSTTSAGGGGGAPRYGVYAGPTPLTDAERIERLERRVAALESRHITTES